jgi:hypothetical protein
MNDISLLTGTNTFQDWYNKTNEIINRINNINGDLISVKDYGALGNGVADDTAGISAAFTAAMGKVLYFPSGIYRLGITGSSIDSKGRQIVKVLTAPMNIIGDNAKIISGRTCSQMIFINLNGKDMKIEGIQFDGDRKANSCVRLDDPNFTTSFVDVDRCGFFNTYDAGQIPGETGSFGLFISGGLKYVNVTNSVFKDINRKAGVGNPGAAGTNGLAIIRSGTSSAPTGPKHVNVSGCYFDNITTEDTGSSPKNLDADGLAVFGLWTTTGSTYADSSTTITNNHFRNCKGRSIKIQMDSAIITNNVCYRNIPSIVGGFSEINCQISGGLVSNNVFIYDPVSGGINNPFTHEGGSAITGGSSCISFYSRITNRSRYATITDNQVFINVPKTTGPVLDTFFSIGRSSTAIGTNPLLVTVKGNKIVGGPVKFFGGVSTYTETNGDTSDTYYSITDNMIEEISDVNGLTCAFLYSSDGCTFGKNNFIINNNVNAKGKKVQHLISSFVGNGMVTYPAKVSGINNVNIGITAETFRNTTTSLIPRIGMIADSDTTGRGGVIAAQSVTLSKDDPWYKFPERGDFDSSKFRLFTSTSGNNGSFMYIQNRTSGPGAHQKVFEGSDVVFQTDTTLSTSTDLKLNVVLNNGDVFIRNRLAGGPFTFSLSTMG